MCDDPRMSITLKFGQQYRWNSSTVDLLDSRPDGGNEVPVRNEVGDFYLVNADLLEEIPEPLPDVTVYVVIDGSMPKLLTFDPRECVSESGRMLKMVPGEWVS